MVNKIVVEGPNNVGKSTLINVLKRHLNFEVEHITEVCPNNYEFYDDLLSSDEPMIFDRLHLGELVYPKIFKRKQNLSLNQFDALNKKHRDHMMIIIVDADYDFIIRACKSKYEEFRYEEVKEERKRFYEIWKRLSYDELNCKRIKNHCETQMSVLVKEVLNECFK